MDRRWARIIQIWYKSELGYREGSRLKSGSGKGVQTQIRDWLKSNLELTGVQPRVEYTSGLGQIYSSVWRLI